MKNIVITVLLLCSTMVVYGQGKPSQQPTPESAPVPVVMMAGNKSGMYQMTLAKKFGSRKQFGFFNLVNYEVDYEPETPDNYIIMSVFSYNLNKHLSVGAGADLKAFGGFKPLVAATYTLFTKDIGLVVQPSVEVHQEGVGELFALFEWYPKFGNVINPYIGVQSITTFNTKDSQHSFSYAYFRAGIQINKVRFGPALNLQHSGSGSSQHTNTNFGGFITLLIN